MGTKTISPYLDTPAGTVLCLRGAAEQMYDALFKKVDTPVNVAFYAGAMSARLLQAPFKVEQQTRISETIKQAMLYANTQDHQLRGELMTSLAQVIAMAPDNKLANLFVKNSDHLELLLDYYSDHALKAGGECSCQTCADVRLIQKGKPLHQTKGKEE